MLRKQGLQGDYSHSHNDHTGNHGFTAPFDESGSNLCPMSDNESETSSVSDQIDADMEDMSRCQEAQEVN